MGAPVSAAFATRGSLREIAGKTSDPDRALGNLLERDRLFTGLLCEETKRLELPAIEVGTAMTKDDLTERVTAAAACPATTNEPAGTMPMKPAL